MPYTITITNDSPQALDFVRFIKNLDFVKVTKTREVQKTAIEQPLQLTTKEKKLQKKISRGLKEFEDFRAGKVELQELDDFLDEI